MRNEQGELAADLWVKKQTKSNLCKSLSPSELPKLAHSERARRLKLIAKDVDLPIVTRMLHGHLVLGCAMECGKADLVWQMLDPVRRAAWCVDMPMFRGS